MRIDTAEIERVQQNASKSMYLFTFCPSLLRDYGELASIGVFGTADGVDGKRWFSPSSHQQFDNIVAPKLVETNFLAVFFYIKVEIFVDTSLKFVQGSHGFIEAINTNLTLC